MQKVTLIICLESTSWLGISLEAMNPELQRGASSPMSVKGFGNVIVLRFNKRLLVLLLLLMGSVIDKIEFRKYVIGIVLLQERHSLLELRS